MVLSVLIVKSQITHILHWVLTRPVQEYTGTNKTGLTAPPRPALLAARYNIQLILLRWHLDMKLINLCNFFFIFLRRDLCNYFDDGL